MSIHIAQLTSRRDGRAVYAPVDLELSAPAAVEITGANGAGKSTLLRTLAGLHTHYDGTFELPPVMYQGHRLGLDGLLNAVENLRWYAQLDGVSPDETAMRNTLDRLGVRKLALTPVARLSQGQQRRVAMARWLLSERRVWLLDEPVTALDQQAQQLLQEVLQDHVAAGGTVLYATHEALPLTDLVRVHVTGVA